MNIEPSEQKERSLSCFFCRELFSLYVEDQLDARRKHQLDHHVEGCPACRHALSKIIFSQGILRELSQTHPTESLINYIRKEQSFWTEAFSKAGWRNWPATLKWAVQLSLVAIILVAGIHFFPWLLVARKLHQFQNSASPIATSNPNLPATAENEGDGMPLKEELGRSKLNAKPAAAPLVDPTLYGPQIPDDLRAVAKSVQSNVVLKDPTIYGPPAPMAALALPATAPISDVVKEDVTPDSTKPDGQMAGFVWKGHLKVDKVTDEVTAKVTKIVTDMGGIKAGQVELGWPRGNERYYHFIIPEDGYDRMLSALNREGIVSFTKESHSRVIKQGHMRVIMTLEENE